MIHDREKRTVIGYRSGPEFTEDVTNHMIAHTDMERWTPQDYDKLIVDRTSWPSQAKADAKVKKFRGKSKLL